MGEAGGDRPPLEPLPLIGDHEVGSSKGARSAKAGVGASAVVSCVASGIALVISLAAIVNTSPGPADSRFEQGGEIEAIRREIQQQRSQLESIMLSGPSKFATLDTAAKGYARADSIAGFFLIRCDGVQPYLDGYKVTLGIANPQIATYRGFRLMVRWGPRFAGDANDRAAVANWDSSLKSTVISFTDPLSPGQWNPAQFTLPQTSAAEIAVMRIAIETDTVLFVTPTPP